MSPPLLPCRSPRGDQAGSSSARGGGSRRELLPASEPAPCHQARSYSETSRRRYQFRLLLRRSPWRKIRHPIRSSSASGVVVVLSVGGEQVRGHFTAPASPQPGSPG